MTPLERRWLAYARKVVADDDHRGLCASLGGSPRPGAHAADGMHVEEDLRWPGYLGRDYAQGGLLWVNIVHRDFATRWTRAGAAGLGHRCTSPSSSATPAHR